MKVTNLLVTMENASEGNTFAITLTNAEIAPTKDIALIHQVSFMRIQNANTVTQNGMCGD